MRPEPRVAFVADVLPVIGGAEKTLFAALECFPGADVFALLYNRQAFANTPLAKRKVFTSYLDKLPAARGHYKLLLPLMPGAIERFDFTGYDIVVSFNYAVANGAKMNGAIHLSYTHTPMRYAWSDLNIRGNRPGNNFLIIRYLRWFRDWDKAAAARVAAFATISHAIAERIRCTYEREARVIYPPVEVERFHAHEKREAYYVVVSRLVAHKRVDVIVDAFASLGLPLKVVGDGPERQALVRSATDNVEFLGRQPDARVAELLGSARGFVCAAEEDFGIAMVEAQAAGCPVIAYGRGGVLETVVDGQTGLLFPRQCSDDLIEAVRNFEGRTASFEPQKIAGNARRFDKANFQTEFQRFVRESCTRA